MTTRKFLLWLGLLTAFAWLLREYFVLVTVVEVPIRGDVRDYVAYAWNLLNHGVFSHAWPGRAVPIPDDFRGPGYPAFLAIWMALDPEPNGWYRLVMHSQAMLGALTATLTVLLGRHWLPRPWSLGAGFLVALWPHHVAATGAMLTEVVFGFALTLALLLAAEALRRRSVAWAVAGGAVFSYAILTNMVALLVPVLAALLCWRAHARRVALILLVCALLGPAIWSIRNAFLAPSGEAPGRITLNLVQGSWPQYHQAYISRNVDPISRDILRAIGQEEQLLASDRRAGVSRMVGRIANDPAYYLRWYALEKPFLLWDWDIRMGAGDVYFHQLTHSPLETQPVLQTIKRMLETLNPAIFALSALASLALLFGWAKRRPWAPPAAVLVAGFCVYITVVHTALQAEPRYSIPYRPMQLLMLTSMLFWIAQTGVRAARSDVKRHLNGTI